MCSTVLECSCCRIHRYVAAPCQQQLKTIDPATAGRQATAGTEEHRKQQDRQQKLTHQEHNGQLQQQERLQQQKRQN